MLHNVVVPVISAIVLGLPIVSSSDGFLYNNDAECSIPFAQGPSVDFQCQGTRQSRNYQYQQVSNNNGCYFGDVMTASGSFVLDQKVNRYFSMAMNVCYYGSENAFYKPLRCKTYRRSIDMWNYAVLEQQGDENEEYQKEGYNYDGYWQDEERQQWNEEQQQAQEYQDQVQQTYLYPGTYSFNIALSIPKKSFFFGNGSELRVTMKLVPRNSYQLKYYRSKTYYQANIKDSKYQTECYLSFASIPIYTDERKYSYYTMAGVGIFLLGAATYVSSKRRVLCACDVDLCGKEKDAVEARYKNHVELPPTKKRGHIVFDGASILTF